MATIAESGQRTGLTSTNPKDASAVSTIEQKFLTFVTDNGAVHTIVVDAEHAAKDADELLRWFLHTKVGVELSAGRVGHPLFKTAQEVLDAADKAVGIVQQAEQPAQQQQSTGEGQVY